MNDSSDRPNLGSFEIPKLMERPIYIAWGETFITLTRGQALALAEAIENEGNPELDPIRTALLTLAEPAPED